MKRNCVIEELAELVACGVQITQQMLENYGVSLASGKTIEDVNNAKLPTEGQVVGCLEKMAANAEKNLQSIIA